MCVEAQTQGTAALRNSVIEMKGPQVGISPPAEKEPQGDPRRGLSFSLHRIQLDSHNEAPSF